MFNIDEYYQELNRLKATRKRLATNNYLSIMEKEDIAKQTDSSLVVFDDIVAMVANEDDFARLYFDTTNLNAISEVADLIDRDIVTDLVGTNNMLVSIKSAVIDCGFSVYSELTRWRAGKINIDEIYKQDTDFSFQKAGINHADQISTMFSGIFDAKVSHLPSEKKIKDLIDDGLVFAALDRQDNICAIVCFERVGKAGIYLYQICVDEKYRGHGLAVKLASFAYNHFTDCISFTSWIENTNISSQKLHSKLGFKPDRLCDTVLILKGR